MISIKSLTKSYGNKKVLDGISLECPENGLVRIMGESGAGKTTLLNIIAGLDKADAGSVQVAGNISMVFQEDRLLPYITALENVKLVIPRDTKIPEQHLQTGTDGIVTGDNERAKIIRDPARILSEMGLADELHTKVRKLSGGMARRTAIARALAKEADIYLMDEPIKGLDVSTAQEVISVIRKYTEGALLVVVTHFADEFADADMTIVLCESNYSEPGN